MLFSTKYELIIVVDPKIYILLAIKLPSTVVLPLIILFVLPIVKFVTLAPIAEILFNDVIVFDDIFVIVLFKFVTWDVLILPVILAATKFDTLALKLLIWELLIIPLIVDAVSVPT